MSKKNSVNQIRSNAPVYYNGDIQTEKSSSSNNKQLSKEKKEKNSNFIFGKKKNPKNALSRVQAAKDTIHTQEEKSRGDYVSYVVTPDTTTINNRIRKDNETDNYNHELANQSLSKQFEQKVIALHKSELKYKIFTISKQVGLIILSVYFVFLVFGMTQTNYYKEVDSNNESHTKALILSVDNLYQLQQYDKLCNYYYQCQDLYQKSLTIDYRLATKQITSLEASMEYTKLLDKVSKIGVDIQSEGFEASYIPIQKQLVSWINGNQNYPGSIAIYLQNISDALSSNNKIKAECAIISRKKMSNNFDTISLNFQILHNKTKGTDTKQVFDWTATKYYQSKGDTNNDS